MPDIAILDIDPVGVTGQHCHAKISIDGHVEYLTISKAEAERRFKDRDALRAFFIRKANEIWNPKKESDNG